MRFTNRWRSRSCRSSTSWTGRQRAAEVDRADEGLDADGLPGFNTNRMVGDYVEGYYLPANAGHS